MRILLAILILTPSLAFADSKVADAQQLLINMHLAESPLKIKSDYRQNKKESVYKHRLLRSTTLAKEFAKNINPETLKYLKKVFDSRVGQEFAAAYLLANKKVTQASLNFLRQNKK